MSLQAILVYAVSALAIMSGIAGYVGSPKSERKRMIWYSLMALFGAIWASSCMLFLDLPVDASEGLVIAARTGIYYGGALMAIGITVFCTWREKWGKAISTICVLFAACFLTLLTVSPEVMFEGYTLSAQQGNAIDLVEGWAYLAYFLFFAVCCSSAIIATFMHSRRVRHKSVKRGDYVLLIGLISTSVFSLIFNVIFPIWVRYDLIWVGPLSLAVTLITFYFALLKFHLVSMDSKWLKILSMVVLMVSGAVIYMLIFYLIFTALFKIPNPSPAILVLNFLMIIIVLLLMPVLNEVSSQIKSLIAVGQVDLAYVVKKLNRVATKNIDLRELAAFLADHLHFSYAGFILNGRLYGSKTLTVTPAQLSQITHMKASGSDIWQRPNKTTQETLDELGIKAVAELRNAKGRTFGQLVVGKPMGKSSFDRRDLIQIEMIINLVATIIDSEKHLRA